MLTKDPDAVYTTFRRCNIVFFISEKSQTNPAPGDAPMNRRPRLTLAGLTVFIALCGVTFAAIRVSSPYWASAMVSLTTLISDCFYVTFGASLPFSSQKADSLSRDVKVNNERRSPGLLPDAENRFASVRHGPVVGSPLPLGKKFDCG
jgi:hypothetical protein